MVLESERTTNIIAYYSNILFRDLKQTSIKVLLLVWRLMRLVHCQSVRGGVVISNQTPRLNADTGMPVEPKLPLDDVRRIRKRCGRIAMQDFRSKCLITDKILVNHRCYRFTRGRRLGYR